METAVKLSESRRKTGKPSYLTSSPFSPPQTADHDQPPTTNPVVLLVLVIPWLGQHAGEVLT